MVKGISRQVIVVQSPDPKLFEQAIFILKDEALKEGVSEELLLKEARQAIRGSCGKLRRSYLQGAACAGAGALLTALAWLLTVLF